MSTTPFVAQRCLATWPAHGRSADAAALRDWDSWPPSVIQLGDLFDPAVNPAVQDAVIKRICDLAEQRHPHVFEIVTEHPGEMKDWLADFPRRQPLDVSHSLWPLPNLHLGVSVRTSRDLSAFIPTLLRTEAAHRFVQVGMPRSGSARIDLLDFGMITMSCEAWRGRLEPGCHNALSGEWWAAVGDPGFESRSAETDLPKIDRIQFDATYLDPIPAASWARAKALRDVSSGYPNVDFVYRQHGPYGVMYFPEIDGKRWSCHSGFEVIPPHSPLALARAIAHRVAPPESALRERDEAGPTP